ncbi:DUF6118 family protein [Sphingobium aquiterrae]|uniref:DUF6118 family protein n=1 Tax=Sphingobium aquiterrae TaxID=2038656 RepID=UPI0030162F15
MNDEHSLLHEQNSEAETAAQAFARLDRRIAVMSRVVEHMATERQSIEVPDYSSTLAQMNKQLASLSRGIEGLGASPALQITPRDFAARIEVAAEEARRTDHDQLVDARARFDQGARNMRALVATARTAGEQRRHLRWAVGGGVLVGILLWSLLPGMIARSAPERWLWPERMAARVIGLNRWRAGERLLATADPDQWDALLATSRLLRDNHDVLDRCANRAQRSGKDARCMVVIKPE